MAIRSFKGVTPQLGRGVFVDHSALVIGDVEIGEDSSVWPMSVIRGDVHRIRIGERCSIQDGTIVHVTHAGKYSPDGYPLIMGNDVTVGHQAILHGCTLEDRILVGMGSVIMDGAVIRSDVVIGAGSMITPGKELESGYLYVGRPAKKVRPLTALEMNYFTYSAANYVALKDDHLQEEYS